MKKMLLTCFTFVSGVAGLVTLATPVTYATKVYESFKADSVDTVGTGSDDASSDAGSVEESGLTPLHRAAHEGDFDKACTALITGGDTVHRVGTVVPLYSLELDDVLLDDSVSRDRFEEVRSLLARGARAYSVTPSERNLLELPAVTLGSSLGFTTPMSFLADLSKMNVFEGVAVNFSSGWAIDSEILKKRIHEVCTTLDSIDLSILDKDVSYLRKIEG